VGTDADSRLTWLPGSECLWGGMSKAAMDCPRDATKVAARLDVLDGVRGPEPGIVAVPVCDQHTTRSAEWDIIEDAASWDALNEASPGAVWLMVREDSLPR
jgi:hypothetical protein